MVILHNYSLYLYLLSLMDNILILTNKKLPYRHKPLYCALHTYVSYFALDSSTAQSSLATCPGECQDMLN